MRTSRQLTSLTRPYWVILFVCGLWPMLGGSVAYAADPGCALPVNVTKGGPPTASAGMDITYTITITNPNSANLRNVMATDTLPAGFTALSATPSAGSCTGVQTGTVTCNVGPLLVGGSVTITIVAHIPAVCQSPTATNNVTVTHDFCFGQVAGSASLTTTVLQPSLGPGRCYPPGSEISDDKAGSILIYNFYTSSASGDPQNNTRVNLTNTNPTQNVAVHLFFVDGTTCSIADVFVCLTKNQTISFLMSDLDPGVSGYIVAVAVDGPPGFAEGGNTGCPISFNFLIGDAYVKTRNSPLLEANLGAEAIAAEFGSPLPGCNANSVTATLPFNGVPGQGYNRLPRTLAVSSIPARADGNDTLLIVNRIGGNLAIGGATLGTIFGILYDDAENALSFSFTGQCQFRSLLSNNFPRTTPRFETFIPAGRTGWMRIFSLDNVGILGAVIHRNLNTNSAPNAFDGGHNLHKLTLNPAVTLTIPIFPPSCAD